MTDHKRKILVLVEGERTDVALMERFTPEKIQRMSSYFVESSDMGKLYLNYPMVEAFYHMETIPDEGFYFRYATLDELLTGQYKQRVNRENRNHDYRKFAVTKEESDIVIRQHMNKAWRLVGKQDDQQYPPTQIDVLSEELKIISSEHQVAVLNTCVFFIPEYNPDLLGV